MGKGNSGDATEDKFGPPVEYVQAESEQKLK